MHCIDETAFEWVCCWYMHDCGLLDWCDPMYTVVLEDISLYFIFHQTFFLFLIYHCCIVQMWWHNTMEGSLCPCLLKLALLLKLEGQVEWQRNHVIDTWSTMIIVNNVWTGGFVLYFYCFVVLTNGNTLIWQRSII